MAALLGMPAPTMPAPADMAARGLTAREIAAQLGIDHAQAVQAIGEITPAQLARIAHTMVDRAIGSPDHLPHAQAAQYLLAAHVPEVYGRQAQQAGSATIRVIVDRSFTLRDAVTIDGETVPAIAAPTHGE